MAHDNNYSHVRDWVKIAIVIILAYIAQGIVGG